MAKAGETKDAKDTKGTTGLSGSARASAARSGEYMEKTENSAKSTQDAFSKASPAQRRTAELREDGKSNYKDLPRRSSPISR